MPEFVLGESHLSQVHRHIAGVSSDGSLDGSEDKLTRICNLGKAAGKNIHNCNSADEKHCLYLPF